MLNPNLHDTVFSKLDYQRYARHLVLPCITIHGQKRLRLANVLCVGLGGLGSACILYLAASGINNIGIIDNDSVELSNLQRQIIYNTSDIGSKKINSVKKNIRSLNPECKISSYYDNLNIHNIMQIIPKYDIVIDGTDNFESKQLISNACSIFHKPHVYGAISEFDGQISVFNYQGGPHYKDFHIDNTLGSTQRNCFNYGVLGVLAGIIGTLQAAETIKIIVGTGSILSGLVLVYNMLHTSFKIIRIRKKYSCLLYSKNIYGFYNELLNMNMSIILNTSTDQYVKSYSITQYLESATYILLIDVRETYEYALGHIPNSINIPLKKLKYKNILDFLQIQSYFNTIHIYCDNNSRTKAAISLLIQHGVRSSKLHPISIYKI